MYIQIRSQDDPCIIPIAIAALLVALRTKGETVGGGWQWGAGVLQVGTRHLAYVGSMGLCVGFVWLVGGHNRDVWGSPLL